jgi:hypothetical protein
VEKSDEGKEKKNVEALNKYNQNIQEQWDSIKRPNLRVTNLEKREAVQAKGTGKLLNKVIIETLPCLEKEMSIKIQENFRTPNRQDQNSVPPDHILVKTLSKDNKEKILKAAREKHKVTSKGKTIRVTTDFSTKILEQGGHGMIYFKLWKKTIVNVNYPGKLSFVIEEEIKTFYNKQKLIYDHYTSSIEELCTLKRKTHTAMKL